METEVVKEVAKEAAGAALNAAVDGFKERKGSTVMNALIGWAKDAVPVLHLSGKFSIIIGQIIGGFGEVLVKAATAFKVM